MEQEIQPEELLKGKKKLIDGKEVDVVYKETGGNPEEDPHRFYPKLVYQFHKFPRSVNYQVTCLIRMLFKFKIREKGNMTKPDTQKLRADWEHIKSTSGPNYIAVHGIELLVSFIEGIAELEDGAPVDTQQDPANSTSQAGAASGLPTELTEASAPGTQPSPGGEQPQS